MDRSYLSLGQIATSSVDTAIDDASELETPGGFLGSLTTKSLRAPREPAGPPPDVAAGSTVEPGVQPSEFYYRHA